MATIRFRKLHPNAQIPRRMSKYAAGLDIYAWGHYSIEPGKRATVRTNIEVAVPHGFEAQVRPRSGLAASHGVTVLNAPGTIDADYRGELIVLLVNHGSRVFEVNSGDRIAQIVVAPVVMAEPVDVEELEPTERGTGGFGSTGGSTGGSTCGRIQHMAAVPSGWTEAMPSDDHEEVAVLERKYERGVLRASVDRFGDLHGDALGLGERLDLAEGDSSPEHLGPPLLEQLREEQPRMSST